MPLYLANPQVLRARRFLLNGGTLLHNPSSIQIPCGRRFVDVGGSTILEQIATLELLIEQPSEHQAL